MMTPVRCLFVALCLSLLGCSSTVSLPRATGIVIQGELTSAPRQRNVLRRDEVNAAVQAGLGRFLQSVDLRAVLEKNDLGRDVFKGFELTAMRPARMWFNFDFAPGDVITHVNGASVEHYDAMIPVFEGLPERDSIEVDLLRGGERVKVTIRIEGRPGDATAPVTAPGGTTAPATAPGATTAPATAPGATTAPATAPGATTAPAKVPDSVSK